MPLHPEAADALRVCIEQGSRRRQRPLIDAVTGEPTHYVFQLRGRVEELDQPGHDPDNSYTRQ